MQEGETERDVGGWAVTNRHTYTFQRPRSNKKNSQAVLSSSSGVYIICKVAHTTPPPLPRTLHGSLVRPRAVMASEEEHEGSCRAVLEPFMLVLARCNVQGGGVVWGLVDVIIQSGIIVLWRCVILLVSMSQADQSKWVWVRHALMSKFNLLVFFLFVLLLGYVLPRI